MATYRDIELGRHHPLSQALAELAREQLTPPRGSRGLAGIGCGPLHRDDDAHGAAAHAGRRGPEGNRGQPVLRERGRSPARRRRSPRQQQPDGFAERRHPARRPRGRGPAPRPPERGLQPAAHDRVDRRSRVRLRDAEWRVRRSRTMHWSNCWTRPLPPGWSPRKRESPAATASPTRWSARRSTTTSTRRGGSVCTARSARRSSSRPAGPSAGLAELAYHFSEGAMSGDTDKAIKYSILAAERAMEVLAYEEAARLFEMALNVLELQGRRRGRPLRPPHLPRRSPDQERRGRQGSAHAHRGRRAGQESRRGGTGQARAALALGGQGPLPGVVDHRQVGLLEDALDRSRRRGQRVARPKLSAGSRSGCTTRPTRNGGRGSPRSR